ncbi:MAG TPA: hypothetical protein PLO61_00330 [Fimbriimonadaceae bacterium]|nr:hypothetical protein [Fimbriimonadaceae bacterium]
MIKTSSFSRSLAVLAGALVVGSAYAVVQDSVTFGPFSPAIGTSTGVTSGTLFTNMFTVTGYSLGRIDYTGNTVEINGTTVDFVNDNFMRITYPGGTPFAQRVVGSQGGYTGTVTFGGSFFVNAGATAPFGGGTWNFNFVNTVDDSPTGGVLDNTMNITFNLTDEPATPPTTVASFDPLADGLSTNSQTYSAAQVRWYKLVLPTGTGATRFLDLDTETSTSATAATALAIWNNSGDLIVSDTSDGSGSLSQLTFGGAVNPRPTFVTGGNTVSLVYNGRDGNLVAGTYYVSVTRTSASYSSPWTATSTSTGTAGLTFRANYNTVSGIPTATDLGTLVDGNNPASFTHAGGIVTWFKFTINGPTNLSRYLDIDLNTTSSDYDFALYSDTGTPLFYVDGFANGAATYPAFFSFGGADNARPALAGLTTAFAGHSGNLATGTYYLAVARFPLVAGAGFAATTTSTTVNSTPVPVRFQWNPVTPPAAPLYAQRLSSLQAVPTSVQAPSCVFSVLVAPDQSDRQLADDFTVTDANGWTINSVEGHFTRTTDSSFPTSINVTFFQKSAGLPGAVVTTQNIPWASVTNVDGGLFGTNAITRRYQIPITPVNLAAGDYFMMIQPVSPAGINSFWFSSSPNTPIAGSPAAYQRGAASTGPTDSGFPATWTASGSGTFATAFDLTMRLEGTVNAPSNVVSGTVDFGQLTAAYNTGANLPTSIPVSFRDGGNSEIATGSATYDPVTGAFSASVPGAVTVPYRVSFKLGFWLRKTMPNPSDPATPVGSYAFGTVTPLVGDSDDDNEVTNFDYSLWAAANGNSVTANTDNDFDGDGEITNFDYSLWAANNGALGDN